MLNGNRSDGDGESVFKSAFKVMVVDHNKGLLNNVTEFLKLHSFEVTLVEDGGAALRILLVKKDKFDLILIDSDLRDVDVSTFLRLTKDMHILSMVMRDQEVDDKFLLKMIKNGAFLVIKRPLTNEVVFQARQHVIRERLHKLEKFKMSNGSGSIKPESASLGDKRKDKCNARKNVKNCYNTGSSNVIQLDDDDDDDDDDESCNAKKKICLEWTEELHDKFLRVVNKLGEENCIPRAIVNAMGVPGLKRRQVANHLQKCLKDGWIFNGKRRQPSSSKDTTISSNISQELGLRRYGRMPPVPRRVENQEQINKHIDATYIRNGVGMDFNHMNNQSFHDSSMTNGFGFPNSGQVFSESKVGQGCGSSLMNGFGLQNNGQVFSETSVGQGCDSSLMNGCDYSLLNGSRLENNEQVFSVPTDIQDSESLLMNGFGLQDNGQLSFVANVGHGSSSHIFPQYQAFDNFFDFGSEIDGSKSFSCMQPNVLDTNYDSIWEQSYSYYDQVIPNQGTWDNLITQEVGEGNI
ncbi:hypothetical protein LXL04_021484 [Taraxacum kok-saghyz]